MSSPPLKRHKMELPRTPERQPASAGPKKLGISLSPSNGTQGKKLVIKNVKPRSSAPSSAFTSQSLATFTRSIRAIVAVPPQPVPESLQALYSLCEGCVPAATAADASYGIAQDLYDRIKLELERKVVSIKQTLARSGDADAQDYLKLLDAEWKAYSEQLGMIRSIFLHLDRTYVLAQKSLLSIWDLGLDIFLHHVIQDDDIAARVTSSLLSFVEKERKGDALPRTLLMSNLSLLSTLSPTCYVTLFITPFIAASADFFKAESNQLINIDALSEAEYLEHVQRRLDTEAERADMALAGSSDAASLKGQILRVVEAELITAHVDDILLGLPDFLEAPELGLTDLTRLYDLLSRVRALGKLKTKLQAYVEKKGFELISDPARDDTMVDSLLAFKGMLDKVAAGPFRDHQELSQAVRAGFEVFINKRQNKPAEMLAKYIDSKMRAGNKAMTDPELEAVLDQVLYFFRFTQAKDLFEAFYTRLFAKRLLLNKSASSDMEKIMLIKLQRECGAAFTVKLETMAKDIDLSNDLIAAYKEHRSHTDVSDGFDLTTNVLTTGNWPSFTPANVILPPDMTSALDRFKLFYGVKYTGRTLTWQHSLDQCVLKAAFPKGKKELAVSLFQALVLMLFNGMPDTAKLGFKDIMTSTGLERGEAIRTLQSLACGRVRVLSKHPKGKDVSDTDEFSVNLDFKDDHVKVRINQIQLKETVEENRSTTDRVFVDRQNHVQLVIVRTLKARKTIKHQELVMEVVTQLKNRFKVETTEIKKAIGSLIERDYMERGETKDSYNYLA